MPFGTLRCANPGSPGHTSTDHGGSRGPFFQVSAQHVRFAASKRRGKREEEKLEQQSSDRPTRPTDLGRTDTDTKLAGPYLSVGNSLDAPHGTGGHVERADDNEEGGG